MAKQEEKQEVARRELFYRGQNLYYLKSLDVREMARFLDSRARRTVLRNFDKLEKFIRSCEKKTARNKKIRTHFRDIIILPKLVGMTIGVHNGQHFQEFPITVEMVGHRLGEFAPTRGRVVHGKAGIGSTKSSRALKK